MTGNIDSWAKRGAAERATHKVKGVLDVANDLVVRVPDAVGRSDTEIAQAVRQVLDWDVTVPDRQIQSTVSGGIVTLEGSVHYWTQRADAERAGERLAGVKQVVNRLTIKPPAKVNSEEIRLAIQVALERQADREASRIDVKVSDALVAVTGVVRTWQEKDAVLGAIRGTRGVCGVTDHLAVQPFA